MPDKQPIYRTEDVRQGEIVLRSRRRKIIFFGGLVALVLLVIVIRAVAFA